MKDTITNNKQRLQIDFSAEALKKLENIQERIDAPTKAEVIRNALKIFDWFVTEIGPDYIIEVQNKEGETIFRIPAKVLLS